MNEVSRESQFDHRLHGDILGVDFEGVLVTIAGRHLRKLPALARQTSPVNSSMVRTSSPGDHTNSRKPTHSLTEVLLGSDGKAVAPVPHRRPIAIRKDHGFRAPSLRHDLKPVLEPNEDHSWICRQAERITPGCILDLMTLRTFELPPVSRVEGAPDIASTILRCPKMER